MLKKEFSEAILKKKMKKGRKFQKETIEEALKRGLKITKIKSKVKK